MESEIVILTSFSERLGFEFPSPEAMSHEREALLLGEIVLQNGRHVRVYITISSGIAGNADPQDAVVEHHDRLIREIGEAEAHPLDHRVVSNIRGALFGDQPFASAMQDLVARIQYWERTRRILEIAERVVRLRRELPSKLEQATFAA